jgi:hypothetical protein
MDPLHVFLALGPLAAYLLLMGLLNVSRRPFVTTGARDFYALGVAVVGLVMIGPLDLFLPESAPRVFGPYVWLLLLTLYVLCLTLLILMIRPRLVIYNITAEQLRPALARIISRLDLEHSWAGESLALPELGVQVQIERFSIMRNISLIAASTEQSYYGWRRLERELAAELREVHVEPHPLGPVLVVSSLVVLCAATVWLFLHPEHVAQGLHEMLRM